EYVDSLVRRTEPRTESIKSPRMKTRITNGGRLGLTAFKPVHQFRQVEGHPGLYGTSVKLSKNPAPEPPGKPFVDTLLKPSLSKEGKHCRKGDKLGPVGQVVRGEKRLLAEKLGCLPESLFQRLLPLLVRRKGQCQDCLPLGTDAGGLLADLSLSEVFLAAVKSMQEGQALEKLGRLDSPQETLLHEPLCYAQRSI